VAALSLLALATVAAAARPALRTITPNLTAAPVVTVGGINAGILPSPERKVRKTRTITCRNALAESFNIASNKSSWSKVSAVPHPRKCLTNPKV
jgi:hypothetical protein